MPCHDLRSTAASSLWIDQRACAPGIRFFFVPQERIQRRANRDHKSKIGRLFRDRSHVSPTPVHLKGEVTFSGKTKISLTGLTPEIVALDPSRLEPLL